MFLIRFNAFRSMRGGLGGEGRRLINSLPRVEIMDEAVDDMGLEGESLLLAPRTFI